MMVKVRGFLTIPGERVRRHYARPAAIGEDRQPGAARPGLLGHQLRAVEEFFDGVHAHDAGALEGGIIDRIFSGHGARMRGCGLCAGRAYSGFEDDDGFDPGHGTRGTHEFAEIRQTFDIQ
jgi:hypothetical protein